MSDVTLNSAEGVRLTCRPEVQWAYVGSANCSLCTSLSVTEAAIISARKRSLYTMRNDDGHVTQCLYSLPASVVCRHCMLFVSQITLTVKQHASNCCCSSLCRLALHDFLFLQHLCLGVGLLLLLCRNVMHLVNV